MAAAKYLLCDLPVIDLSATAPARLATRLSFFAAGYGYACWAPLIPYVKANVGADEAQFGLLLLCLGLGSVLAMPVTGWIATRHGSRSMVLLGGFGMVAILPLLALAAHGYALALVLFLFGASIGTLDVAMNVHGAEVERREKRALMSGFHAQFSIGNFAGAGTMTVLLSLGLSAAISALVGAGLSLLVLVLTGPRLLRARGGTSDTFALPRGLVLVLAILAAIAFLVEGAVLDWSALLIIQRDLASTQAAGIGFMLFSAAMVTARLTGDRLVQRLGDQRILVGGGLLTCFGIAVVLLAPWPLLALAGFVLVGLGAANIVPVLFSIAGRQTIMPAGLAIAAVTTTGYAGVLLGPALIGFAAHETSLSAAFWILAILMIAVPLTASRIVRL